MNEEIQLDPAMVLLLAADTVHGDPSQSTPQGALNAQRLIDGMLAAAFAGGYAQVDILRTLLARNHPSPRVMGMARAACAAAGGAAIGEIFNQLRLA